MGSYRVAAGQLHCRPKCRAAAPGAVGTAEYITVPPRWACACWATAAMAADDSLGGREVHLPSSCRSSRHAFGRRGASAVCQHGSGGTRAAAELGSDATSVDETNFVRVAPRQTTCKN